MPHTVLITDPLDSVCFDLLEAHGIETDVQLKSTPEALREHARHADGWLIRSGTQITADLLETAEDLKVIGRAGVGVDNVDLEAATRRGILVINAPDGNTISTAEHACALMMALARRLPQANASLREGSWERKSFTGAELYEKTLGIVGVGKIGQAVAQRMGGFGMTLLGFDPVLAPDVAARLGVTLVSFADLIARSDLITVHAPLNDATRGLLGADALARCKPGVLLVNAARGGIIDEAALLDALENGHVGGAALDVYSTEPPPPHLQALIRHPRVVATPHIAASTAEAQEKVARHVTEQMIHALAGEPVTTPVNAGAIRMAAQPEAQPYVRLADQLGQLAGQLADGHVERMIIRCHGEVPHRYAEVLAVSAMRGVLTRWADRPVNLVNARLLAEEMGLAIEEQRSAARSSYTNLVEVALKTDAGGVDVAGAVFGDDARLVRVDEYPLELRPEGRLLFYRNVDRPGMLAAVGTILAQSGLNIGALALGRKGKGSPALTAVSVDEPIPEAVRQQIAALDGVERVHAVTIDAAGGG